MNSNTPPPAARNAAQTPPQPDNRQGYYQDLLAKQKRNLIIQTTSLFSDEDGEKENAVTVVARLLESWVLTEYKSMARTTDDVDLKFWDEHIRKAVDVICCLSMQKDIAANIEDYEQAIKREGGIYE